MTPQPTARLGRTVALCFLVAALEGFDIQALGIAAPRMVPELGFTPSQVGWLFSIGNIGLIFGAVSGGRISDHVGRRRMLVLATLSFGLFTLPMAFLHSYAALMSVRFLAGIGFGAAVPNLMTLAAESSPKGRRGTTIALTMCGLPVGGSVVALVSQFLPSAESWRLLFLLGGLAPLPLVWALARFLPETYREPGKTGEDALPVRDALFGEGRTPRTLLVWCAFLPLMAALYLILNWLPILATAKGLAARSAPLASLAFNLASLFGSVLIARWIDLGGRRWPIALSSLAVIAALLSLARQSDQSGLLLASGATGFFLMAVIFALYEISATQYPRRGRGTGAGTAAGVGRVGSVLGPLVAGWLLNSGTSANTVLLVLVPVVGVAGLSLFVLSFLEPGEGAR
ncbi:MAG: hypothetical protein RLZZ200_2385 [Pseudomonadota bacterium]|jgi:AAHS family 3-hydroxyphenylpropionic acid transporter